MRVTGIGTLIVSALCFATAAGAQSYPAKPIRLVVAFAPGGGVDIMARLLSQKMTENWGQTVPVDNRPGAGGNIAAEIVAKAPPDGYTLLLTSAAFAVNVSLYPKLAYNPQKDLAPVTQIVSTPILLVVHPSVPAKSVKELVALSKSRKGGLNFGSNGSGTTSHLSGELLKLLAGMDLTHIPYRGAGPAMTGILSGEADMGFVAVFSGLPYVKSGRLRALAVTTAHRSSAAPELPTLASYYPGLETDNWYGLFAPAGTPRDIIYRVQQEVARFLQLPEVKAFNAKEGAEPVGSTPEQLTAFLQNEIAKYAEVVRKSGAKPE